MAEVPRAGAKGEVGAFFLDQFEGLNTQSPRSSIKDQQLSWSMNMMPLGPGNMRALKSNGTVIYTAPGNTTIIYYCCFNNSSVDYIAVFLDDGRADQVNFSTLAVTPISATPGTFYNGTSIPAVSRYSTFGILIIGNVGANSYWAWDGTLYTPGTPSPPWLNGGTPTTMPTGLFGNAIEIYQSRVWTFNGAVCTFSAPGNGAQFGSAGAGTFKSTDSFLRKLFVAALQSNGFLYLFGDSSISVISNVQTSGTPAVTTFSNTNIDPQVSTPWPLTVQAFGRGILFANTSGVYVLFGGTAEKVSSELDGVFETANFSRAPSAAVATIYGIRCYCIAINSLDPISSVFKVQMFCWDGKRWFPATQDAQIQTLATQEINSALTALASDGVRMFAAFQTSSATLPKVVRSKLWGGKGGYVTTKQALRVYAQAFDTAGAGIDLTMEIDAESQFAVTTLNLGSPINFVNNTGGIIQFQNNTLGDIFFQSSSLAVRGRDINAYGLLFGMTITSLSPDFTLVSAGLQYQDYAPFG